MILQALALAALLTAAPAPTKPTPLDGAVDAAAAQGFAGEVLVTDAKAVTYARAVSKPGRPHRPGDLWRWASVTKQLTATLVLQAVQKGELSLDDTVAQRLPAFIPFLLAALLLRWSKELLRLDFQGALMLLQKLPTGAWGEAEVSELLSEAHQHRARFAGAESHLTSMGS